MLRTELPPLWCPPAHVPESVLAAPLSASTVAAVTAVLAAVETRCTEVVAGAGAVLDVAQPPYAGAGLRLQPLLTALAAAPRPGGPTATPVPLVDAAVVFEFSHLAMAYHRRLAGSRDVLAGDWLIVRATALVAGLPAVAARLWADGLRVAHELALVGRPDAATTALSHYAVAAGRRLGPGPLETAAMELIRELTAVSGAGVTRTERAPR